MRLVKLGIASVNSTVGAVRSNVDRCIAAAQAFAAEETTLAVFPEQVVGGYAAEDLVQWRAFVASQQRELRRFAEQTSSLATVFVIGVTVGIGGDLFNCGALVHRGKILGFCPKEKLPTYNIFYEARTFSRGTPYLALDAEGVFLGDRLYSFDFGTVAMEVCEDIWSPDGPMRRRCYSGAEIVCNLSASPFRAGVTSTRREMIATRASDNQCTVVYANLVGGNDGLVFDGGGYVNQNGRPMLDAPASRRATTPRSSTSIAPRAAAARRAPGAPISRTSAAKSASSPPSRSRPRPPRDRTTLTPRPRKARRSSSRPAPRPPSPRATSCSTISSTRSRSPSPTTTGRQAPSAAGSASPSPAAATRC